MAKANTYTASTVVKPMSGNLYGVNITKAGSADATFSIFDNPTTNTGTKLFDGAGAVTGSFLAGAQEGIVATTGMYIAIAGTTAPIIQVIWS